MRLVSSGQYKYVSRGQPKLTTEHRVVLMTVDPREDAADLEIHHVDGNKGNNDPANLVWMTKSEHSRLHHLGENHFPCGGKDNANYRHGMCVGGQSKEYKKMHNRKDYQAHKKERLEKQKAYADAHKEHISWYHKMRYWEKKLQEADTDERRNVCENKIKELKENKP